jgi:hypothetical protein
MSKAYPQFHVEFTAVGLRVLRQHWGPINRKEVELRQEAYELLRDVEAVEAEPVPEPEPPTPEQVVVTVMVPEGVKVNVVVEEGD